MKVADIALILLGVLFVSVVACQLSEVLQAPTPTPTKTPIPTSVPTATAAPTPTVDPWTLVTMPYPDLALSALSGHYEDFEIVTDWGMTPDTRVYKGFEADGGLYLAAFAIVDGKWALAGVMEVDRLLQAEGRRQ